MYTFVERILVDCKLTGNEPLNRDNLIKINKSFRKHDQSELFPINGAFNVTNRAIRINRQIYAKYRIGRPNTYEYCRNIKSTISNIVNGIL